MLIYKSADDIAFLQRVDSRYRDGQTQEQIALSEGFLSPGALHSAVTRMGFRFERKGGLKLVDTLFGRTLADWISSEQLRPTSGEAALLAA